MPQALARKYRPQDFESVVGQETAVRILGNALSSRRIHHAYLFAGPRGIGKTSIARIFAKALNCERDGGPTPKPCNECISCREITEGRSLSVIEIDGASNNSVDSVRDLREKIGYLPPGGRYKIYIIDEVHMLSTAAFNALLKTLEEPPPHALFLFATTDPEKVLTTVLSRVIRFDLRPITRTDIVAQLKKIAASESIAVSEEALFQIAREASGGLRDALSLLDQIVSYARGGSAAEVTSAAVEEVVGVSTRRFVRELAEATVRREPSRVLKISEAAFDAGVDAKRLSLDLLELFRHLLVAQVTQDAALFDLPQDEIDELAKLAREINTADLDRLFRILQKGIVDLLRSPLPKVLLEVLLLRLAQWEGLQPLEEILTSLKSGPSNLSRLAPAKPDASAQTRGRIPILPRTPIGATSPVTNPTPVKKMSESSWPEFLAHLRTKSAPLAALIEQGTLGGLGETEVILHYPAKSMNRDLLKDPDRAEPLQQYLRDFFHRPVAVRFETSAESEGTEKVAQSIVKDAISIFNPAKVVGPKGEA